MSNLPSRQHPLRILVVGAHPADAFDNAGGTCYHHAQQGDVITSFILTGGARVHDEIISDYMRTQKVIPPEKELRALMAQRIAVKQKEVFEACAIMGIHDVRFSLHDDGVFLLSAKVIDEITRLIREIRPHLIITHYPYDHGGMADQHAITGQSVVNAVWNANSVEPGDSNPPWSVSQIFFMGFPSSFVRNNALAAAFSPMYDVFVDVSDVIHLKKEALDKMKSQKYDGLMAQKRLEAVEGSAGMACGVAYAEPFISYRSSLCRTLPISSLNLERAGEVERKRFERISFVATRDQTLSGYRAKMAAMPQ